MKKLMMILCMVVLSPGLLQAEEEDFNQPRYYGLKIGFESYDQTSGNVGLSLLSPYLFTYEYKERTSGVSLFAKAATLSIKNVVADEEGKFEDQYNDLFTAGVQITNPRFIRDSIRSYVQIGAAMIKPTGELSEKDSDLGYILTIGGEFFLSKAPSLFGDHEASNALYIESGVLGGLTRADKLEGEPDLFNGPFISLGVSFYE